MYNKDNSQLSLYHINVLTTTDNLSKILAGEDSPYFHIIFQFINRYN